MENFLRNCVMGAAFVVAMFCFSYYYMERESDKMSKKADIETVVEKPRQEPIIIYKTAPPVIVPTPKPVVVKPVIYYTASRVTEFTEVGVRAIPQGVKVDVNQNDDGSITVSDGKQTIKTRASSVTSDLNEISKLTSKKRP